MALKIGDSLYYEKLKGTVTFIREDLIDKESTSKYSILSVYEITFENGQKIWTDQNLCYDIDFEEEESKCFYLRKEPFELEGVKIDCNFNYDFKDGETIFIISDEGVGSGEFHSFVFENNEKKLVIYPHLNQYEKFIHIQRNDPFNFKINNINIK
jgi:hypothetical protein